jgi:hypothetical protein
MRKPDVTFYVDGDGNKCVEMSVKLGVNDLNDQYRWLLALSQVLDSRPEALQGILNMHEAFRERIQQAERGLCPRVTDEEHIAAVTLLGDDVKER